MDGDIIAVMVFAAAAGLMWVFWGQWRAGHPKRDRSVIEMPCEVCERVLIFSKDALTPLSSVEIALVVRAKNEALRHKLSEYICPHCQAAHCFITDKKAPRLLGVNLYEPQQQFRKCQECGKSLTRPPWAPGAYDNDTLNAPGVLPDYGLICEYCGGLCCVACCETLSFKQISEEILGCPRCRRPGMTRFLEGN